ncbi:DUF202 domain-containing protein [Actinokineospora sp. NPDC004072]
MNGLQAERTRLAWGRTGLACAGVGALLLHNARGVLGFGLAGLVLLAAAAFAVIGARRDYGSEMDNRGMLALALVPPLAAIAVLLAG